MKNRTGAQHSTREGGAEQMTERSEHTREAGDGIAHGPGSERQARAASSETAGDETTCLMEQVVCRENMLAAHRRVVGNRGAPGVDGMTVEELMPYCREEWAAIRRQLLEGNYQPRPIRQVDIPKPGGRGTRKLGIPCVIDRLIQQAILQTLQPIFDPTFSDASFGFRPRRSTHQAVRRARVHIADGYRWCVDLDLEKFFDRVNHDVLMARLARRMRDKRLLCLIRRYLQAGIMAGGVISPRAAGTPQGSPLSPLLSNVLLDDLDQELERRGHRFVRYADDVNVYVRSKRAGERVMDSLERFLTRRLRLKVNRTKSAVDRPWNRTFLGYTVTNNFKPKLRVAPESEKRLKERLRPIFRRGRGRSLPNVIREVNLVLRGWAAYFRLADVRAAFGRLDEWIRHHLRCILWRQWKTAKNRCRELIRRGLCPERAKKAAAGGRGPWFNAASSHMNHAVPRSELRRMDLVSLLDEHRRLAYSS